ncbi:MAG TPA: methylated-DNA--[protein]-cysteine S-methyltransferase [Thioalkalivibrio sp.]|nr:methylated-DNA--[protein]-cysteine S-methyltransferase [Thioalkalivibrio sp.]
MCPDAVISSPLGRLGIRCQDDALSSLTYLSHTEPLRAPTGLAAEVADQLDQYFSNPDFRFQLPLKLEGTVFQERVWSALAEIPRGELRSYGELARELQSGPRAVGGACARNPVIIVVPCHRVVPVTGGLGGYGGSARGAGVNIKAWLVRHECARLYGRSVIP